MKLKVWRNSSWPDGKTGRFIFFYGLFDWIYGRLIRNGIGNGMIDGIGKGICNGVGNRNGEGNEIGNCKGHKLSTLCLVEIE